MELPENGDIISWMNQVDPVIVAKRDALKKLISGPSLQKFYESIAGAKKTLKEIVMQKETDPYARHTLDRLNHFFGKAVSSITNMLDPDIIVVGGGVGNIDEIYTEGVEILKHFIFNNYCTVPVIRPRTRRQCRCFRCCGINPESLIH